MADLPYSSNIRKIVQLQDLATRLHHFRQIYDLIESSKIIDSSDIKDDKVDNAAVSQIAQDINNACKKYLSGGMTEDEETKLLETADNFPETMDIALSQDENESNAQEQKLKNNFVQNVLYKLAMRKREKILRSHGYERKLASAECNDVNLNLKGTLYMVLNQEDKNISEEVVNRMLGGTLELKGVKSVSSALRKCMNKVSQRLKIDWQTYESMNQPDSKIEMFRPDFENIAGNSLRIDYKPYPELCGVRLCLREDCDKTDGSKQTFLKIMGNLLDNKFSGFETILKQNYGDKATGIIDEMLGLKDEELKNNPIISRRNAFSQKSEEIYYKFLAAVLVLKYDEENQKGNLNFNYTRYIQDNVGPYINKLKDGKNECGLKLLLTNTEKATSARDLIDETAEKQIISLHHRDVPVAAAVDAYIAMHPQFHSFAELKDFANELKRRAPQAIEGKDMKDLAAIGLALSVFPQEDDKMSKLIEKCDKPKQKEYLIKAMNNKNIIKEIYQKYFPLNKSMADEISKEICEIINNIGNYELPTGRDVHNRQEPNGKIEYLKSSKGDILIKIDSYEKTLQNGHLTDKKISRNINSNTILAAEFELAKLNAVMAKLPKDIADKLRKYNKSADGKTVKTTVQLRFPNTPFKQYINEKINSSSNNSLRDIYQSLGITYQS